MIQVVDHRKTLTRDQILAEHLADIPPEALQLSPVLYVGANPRSKNYWLKELIKNKVEIDVVEPQHEYCEWLRKQAWVSDVFEHGLLELDKLPLTKGYGAVIWREGPQYLPPGKFAFGMQICEQMARHYVTVTTPWAAPSETGLYLGVKNLHPIKAYAYLTPQHFDELGYDVTVRLVDEDQIQAFMLAVKEL